MVTGQIKIPLTDPISKLLANLKSEILNREDCPVSPPMVQSNLIDEPKAYPAIAFDVTSFSWPNVDGVGFATVQIEIQTVDAEAERARAENMTLVRWVHKLLELIPADKLEMIGGDGADEPVVASVFGGLKSGEDGRNRENDDNPSYVSSFAVTLIYRDGF